MIFTIIGSVIVFAAVVGIAWMLIEQVFKRKR